MSPPVTHSTIPLHYNTEREREREREDGGTVGAVTSKFIQPEMRGERERERER